jgi:hypothetical protein
MWRQSRLESECVRGEGLQLTFPDRTCSPFDDVRRGEVQWHAQPNLDALALFLRGCPSMLGKLERRQLHVFGCRAHKETSPIRISMCNNSGKGAGYIRLIYRDSSMSLVPSMSRLHFRRSCISIQR